MYFLYENILYVYWTVTDIEDIAAQIQLYIFKKSDAFELPNATWRY